MAKKTKRGIKKRPRHARRAPEDRADADGVAGELLAHTARAVRASLEELQAAVDGAARDVRALDAELVPATDPAARSAIRKELRDARSHLAWISRQHGAQFGDLSRVADRERKHTGRLSADKVIAWARRIDREDLEMLVEQLADIAEASTDDTTKDGGLLS